MPKKKKKGNFNYPEQRDTTAGILLIRAMTEVLKPSEDIRKKFNTKDTSNMVVNLVVNGVEVPFQSCMESLERHIEEHTAKEAGILVGEKLQENMDKLDDVFTELLNNVKEQFSKKFNIEIED